MNKTFLNDDELKEVTEYVVRKKQHTQLSKMGIPFEITRTGRPLVLRSKFEEILGGKAGKPQQEVNFDALRSLTNG